MMNCDVIMMNHL